MCSFKDLEKIIPWPKEDWTNHEFDDSGTPFEILLVPKTYSRRIMVKFIAAPTHLAGLVPLSTGHGLH